MTNTPENKDAVTPTDFVAYCTRWAFTKKRHRHTNRWRRGGPYRKYRIGWGKPLDLIELGSIQVYSTQPYVMPKELIIALKKKYGQPTGEN